MGSTPVPNPSPPSFLELSLSKKGDSDLAYEGFQSHVPTTEDGRDEKTKVYGRIIPSRPFRVNVQSKYGWSTCGAPRRSGMPMPDWSIPKTRNHWDIPLLDIQ